MPVLSPSLTCRRGSDPQESSRTSILLGQTPTRKSTILACASLLNKVAKKNGKYLQICNIIWAKFGLGEPNSVFIVFLTEILFYFGNNRQMFIVKTYRIVCPTLTIFVFLESGTHPTHVSHGTWHISVDTQSKVGYWLLCLGFFGIWYWESPSDDWS